jgi:uncharacterized protein (DUF433 family)
MNWKAHIHSNPQILLGKPVIKGTRISVEFILGLFSEGWTQQQVLESYPTLNAESIQVNAPYKSSDLSLYLTLS